MRYDSIWSARGPCKVLRLQIRVGSQVLLVRAGVDGLLIHVPGTRSLEGCFNQTPRNQDIRERARLARRSIGIPTYLRHRRYPLQKFRKPTSLEAMLGCMGSHIGYFVMMIRWIVPLQITAWSVAFLTESKLLTKHHSARAAHVAEVAFPLSKWKSVLTMMFVPRFRVFPTGLR